MAATVGTQRSGPDTGFIFRHYVEAVNDPDAARFELQVVIGQQEGVNRKNTVYLLGYNVNRDDTSEPSLGLTIETCWEANGVKGMEWHLQYYDTAQVSRRPITFWIPHVVGAAMAGGNISLDQLGFNDFVNGTQVLLLDLVNKVLDVQGGAKWRHSVNNAHIALQINAAADAWLTLPYYNASDHMVLGDIAHTGTKAGFYSVAPTTRQLLATGAGATVDNVITALQTLGLVRQS